MRGLRSVALSTLVLAAGCAASVGPGTGDAPDAFPPPGTRPSPPPDAARCWGSPGETAIRTHGALTSCEPGDLAECVAPYHTPGGFPALFACDPAAPQVCTKADHCDATGCHCGAEPPCGDQEACVRGDVDDPTTPAHCDCLPIN